MAIRSSNPPIPHTLADSSAHPPWKDPAAFPVAPSPLTYGYRVGKTNQPCSQVDLVERIQRDTRKQITFVWTPDAPHLLPPEEVPWLAAAVRAREHAALKHARFYAIVNTIGWGVMLAMSANSRSGIAPFPLFLVVVLGIIPFLEHTWGLYRLRVVTPATMNQQVAEARYTAWLAQQPTPWTWALVLGIALVGIVQGVLGLWFVFDPTHSTIAAAGIVKPAIRAGEWWRLLTGTLLHANIMHVLFNSAALIALGKILEGTFHRAYVPLVFVLTALSGSLWSMALLPTTTSVGASGGILGLLGFVLVLGWRHRGQFPQPLYRSLLRSVIYTLVAGGLAYQAIDNPAHASGLIAGALLGMAINCSHHVRMPDQQPPLIIWSSYSACAIIFATAAWCLLRIFGL